MPNLRLPGRGLEWLEGQLVTLAGCAGLDGSYREFDDRMRRQAEGHSPRDYVRDGFADYLFFVDVDKIEREFHEEGVDAFAGDDPQAFTCSQFGVFQETRRALLAGIGYVYVVAEDGAAG